MNIEGVIVGEGPIASLVILRTADSLGSTESLQLPIRIGSVEATAITMGVGGRSTNRPLTHDLLRSVIEALGAKVDSVRITAVEGTTFFAQIDLLTSDGQHVLVDSRPSDAIALAVRTDVTILAEDSVLSTAALPDFRGVDVGPEGADLDQLAVAVSAGAKLFYSIPNHQNPSGASYSEDVRKGVADIIRGSGCMLIEDDAYGELGYDGRVGRTMKSMAPEDTVLTGSFSKTISPGMRVGWMVVPDWMVAKAGRSLEACCLQSNTFCQRIIDRFLQENDYDAYLDRLRAGYARKKRVFLDAMEDNLPDTVSWNDPQGGMFVWLKTPEGTDAMRLYERLLEGKLVVMPGGPFHVRGGRNTIRLNFATPTDEQIEAGMKVLGRTCRELYS